jgi:hypothetical protein
MLPTWWHAMKPHEKKGVAAVAEAHGRQFTVECFTEMHLACSIPMKDMQNLRLYLECSWENPAQLDTEEPIALDNQSAISVEVTEAPGLVKDASSGLGWFQLKPPSMKGQKLLDHMFFQRQLSFKTKETHLYIPNSYLDIAIKPSNIEVLKYMTAPDLSKRAIMKDSAGNGATLNLSARKLNQTGYVQRRCGFVNTEVKVRKLNNALQLSQYMATITNGQCSERAQQSVEKHLEYRTLAPVAFEKLKGKNGELNKITKNEILSIMYFYFLILGNDKKNKPLVIAAFMHCYLKAPEKIPFRVWCTDASPAPLATIAWEMDDDDAPFDVGVQLITK